MNHMRITVILSICLSLVLLLGGCGGEQSETATETESAATATTSTADSDTTRAADRAEITAAMTETLWRWKYRDKAALYDMEFPYFHDDYTFDEYYKMQRIFYAYVDSLIDYRITEIAFYESDSAMVYDELTWQTATGDTVVMPNQNLLYNYNGRWYRPTVSNFQEQLQIDDLQRISDSLATSDQ